MELIIQENLFFDKILEGTINKMKNLSPSIFLYVSVGSYMSYEK